MSLLDLFDPNSSSSLTFVEPDPRRIEAPPPPPQIKLLRVRLGSTRSLLLPLTQIKGVQPLSPLEILPIPEMPLSVLGTWNWRGEFLWALDLGSLLGYPALDLGQMEQLMGVIVHHQERAMGLIVPEVDEIESYELSDFLPPLANWIPPHVQRYAQGYIRSSGDLVLQVAMLISAPHGS